MMTTSAIEARAEWPGIGPRKQRTRLPMPVNTRPKAKSYNGPARADAFEPSAKRGVDRPAFLSVAMQLFESLVNNQVAPIDVYFPPKTP
jgi:hypothetical protein